MLDAFAYPVSLLMKLWHDLLLLVLPAGSTAVWPVSLLLLVLTVRLVLLRPAWTQLLAGRRTQLMQPQLAELKRQYRGDSRSFLLAAQALSRREGVGLGSSAVPALLQIPVFTGLYRLLAGFTLTGHSSDNGAFDPTDVASFAHATVFGVPLSAAIRTPLATLQSVSMDLTQQHVIAVVAPLLLIAALATFINAWRSQRRQAEFTRLGASAATTASPFAAEMQRMTAIMVWLAPAAVLLVGTIVPLPLAIVIYTAINSVCTTIQTQWMAARVDRLLPL